MICTNCGTQVREDIRFCPECGTLVSAEPEPDALNELPSDDSNSPDSRVQAGTLPEGMSIDRDGTIHWGYRLKMLRNYSMLITMAKVLGIIFGSMALFISIPVTIIHGIVQGLKVVVIMVFGIGGFVMLTMVVAWLIMCLTRGGYYSVSYEMNETKVAYLATPEEQKRARNTAIAAGIFALFTKRPGAMGAAAAAATVTRMDSEYSSVKSIQTDRRHDLIWVNGILQHNMIYVAPHQFEFVYRYIQSHCPDAKIK